MRKLALLLIAIGFVVSASWGQTSAPAQAQPVAQAPAQAGAPTEVQTAHIVTGRSMVITVPGQLKRVLVSNPTVLEAVTASPSELVVTGKATGTSSLILWEQGGDMRIIDVFSDLDVSGLREAIQRTYPGLDLQVEAEQGRVVISGKVPDPATAEAIGKMAGTFSKDVVNGVEIPAVGHSKQIMLKVRFAEVDRSKLSQWGFNLISTGAANTIGTVSTQQFGAIASQQSQGGSGGSGGRPGFASNFTLSDLLNIFVFRPDINLGATIKALQQENVLQILAEPNLLAIPGQPAHFLAGGEFPYPVVQGIGGGNATAITIQFRPYGVKLDFLGLIDKDGVIRLKVTPEVSTLDYANGVTISGFTIPAIATRRTETEFELKDGQSFGIAGLMDNRTIAQYAKIPGIGNIPILGYLFKSKGVTRSNTELMVLVTPTLVDPVNGVIPSAKEPTMPYKPLDVPKFDEKVGDKEKKGN